MQLCRVFYWTTPQLPRHRQLSRISNLLKCCWMNELWGNCVLLTKLISEILFKITLRLRYNTSSIVIVKFNDSVIKYKNFTSNPLYVYKYWNRIFFIKKNKQNNDVCIQYLIVFRVVKMVSLMLGKHCLVSKGLFNRP